ncbi:MAG: hypothetical protein KAQ98_10325 [Bacteriovoracaceae bacterium]|nr:hypothetical protein [Bacteriovoracaceae bacterium]
MNKFVLAILFVFSFQVFALDTGTGADGPCVDVDLGDAVAVSALNCSSLTITGNKDIAPNGGAIVKIKVTGDVIINGALCVNASASLRDGADGGGPNGPGGAGGPAAGAGGYGGSGANGGTGVGIGAGGGGGLGSGVMGYGTGGGGGGGRYSDTALPTDGVAGDDENDGIDSAGTAGVAGAASYGSQITFTTTISGGSGGGGGGSGDAGGAFSVGAGGGGGGGVIWIIAGGDITVAGSIEAIGGNGGNAASFGGGGAGGSGGAVFLQAEGNIFVELGGSVIATGGNGGIGSQDAATPPNDGDGGDGGDGRIRIDDVDGAWSGGGTVNPAPYQAVVAGGAVSSSETVVQIDSKIKSACGSIAIADDERNDFIFSLMIGVLSLSFLFTFIRKFRFS